MHSLQPAASCFLANHLEAHLQTITAGPEYKQSKQKENRGARSDCNLQNCGVWSEVL